MEQLCLAAEAAGLTEVCVTDHVEAAGPYADHMRDETIRAMIGEAHRVREEFAGRVRLDIGMELGRQPENPLRTAEILAAGPVDFVIGSLHNIPWETPFGRLEYPHAAACREILDRYFAALLDFARDGEYDVLGHISYPLRYMHRQGIDMPPDGYRDVMREIFRTVIGRGRGIEINTSGLRDGMGTTMPGGSVLALYREMGGEILTVGSDAHRAEDVGSGIDEACRLAEEAGFRSLTVFRERKPVFLPLTQWGR